MKFEGFVERKTFRVTSTDGITECFQHYDTLSKEQYRKILEQRVQQFVVWNKRIMNPVDDRDKIAHFHTFWEGDRLLACLRILPPFIENWEGYQYPVIDRATIVDKRISMLEGGHAKPEHCFTHHIPDLYELYKSGNTMMEMYKEGHELMEKYAAGEEGKKHSEQTSYHRWVGMSVDPWKVPSYIWVHETETQEQWLEKITPTLH